METKDILIKIAYKGRSAESVSCPLITSGSVDTVSVQFEFDEAWNGFVKRAIFASSSTIIQKLLDESGLCEVPWEVLTHPGDISIGVVGQNDMEIIPSVKTTIRISEGTDTSGDASKTPSSDIYDQMIQIMKQTLETASALHNAAAAGEFDGKDGQDGKDGYAPKRGVDYFTDADIAYAISLLREKFVQRSSENGIVYVRIDNAEAAMPFSSAKSTPYTMVRRDSRGGIVAADPVHEVECATKRYVDEKIRGLENLIKGASE